MTHPTARRIEEEANRYGFFLIRSDGRDGHRVTWQLNCGYCPAQRRFYGWSPNTSPDMMLKNGRQAGWKLGLGDKPECPVCSHPRKTGPVAAKNNVVPIKVTRGALMAGAGDGRDFFEKRIDTVITMATAPDNFEEVDVTEKTGIKKKENTMTETINAAVEIMGQPTPKIMRAVFEGLAAYFDEKAHLYTGGYSDLKLAKEIGTSETVVARLRRDSYGELAEDPLITSLRNAIAHLDVKMGDQARDNANNLRDLRSRVEQMATRTKSR